MCLPARDSLFIGDSQEEKQRGWQGCSVLLGASRGVLSKAGWSRHLLYYSCVLTHSESSTPASLAFLLPEDKKAEVSVAYFSNWWGNLPSESSGFLLLYVKEM